MMKNISLFTLLYFWLSSLQAQINPAGENFVYSLSKDGNNAAEIYLQTDKQISKLDQITCYKITGFAKITAALGIINFENKITSWIDAKSFKTCKVHAYFNDGKKKTNYIVECNHNKRVISAYSLENPNDKKTFSFAPNTEDAWSAFFLIRRTDFSKMRTNDLINFDMMTEENKTQTISLKYLGKKTMKFGNTSQECYILAWAAPEIVDVKTKSIRIAITADKEQVPAKIYVDTSKGFFTAELKSFKK
ncbi:MAG: hypothetical protein OHK0045_01880 [Raineya sp.]